MPYSYYYWGFDPTYILVLIGAVICLVASARVKSTYNKYASYRSMSGMTGAQAAERILHSAGIYDVSVQHVSGNLTDHYNPSNKTLNLSDSVYGSTSVAAVGVAAHECGHAIQHQQGYVPLTLRSAIVPVANIGSTLPFIQLPMLAYNAKKGKTYCSCPTCPVSCPVCCSLCICLRLSCPHAPSISLPISRRTVTVSPFLSSFFWNACTAPSSGCL